MITDLILMGKLVVNSEDSTNIFGMSKEKMRLINGDVESPLPDQAAFLGDFLKIFIEYVHGSVDRRESKTRAYGLTLASVQ